MLPEQIAAWHVFEALWSGDATVIGDAVQEGAHSVGAALAGIPDTVGELVQDVFAGNW